MTAEPSTETDARARPWQPFTWSGVAAFAYDSFSRLWTVQAIMATVYGGLVASSAFLAWGPAIDQAISRLPEYGMIRNGEMEWVLPGATNLVQNRFLAIEVDPSGSLAANQTSDLVLIFQRNNLRLRSVLGYVEVPYPPFIILDLSRATVEPVWGAWRPAIFIGTAAVVAGLLLVCWGLLGLVYLPLARFLAFVFRRRMSWAAAYRMTEAALIPGGTLMSLGILVYSFQQLDLLELGVVFLLHFAVAIVYLLGASFFLPALSRPSRTRRRNPFAVVGL